MSEKPRTINHFSHHHPLKLHKKHLAWTGRKLCWVCGEGDYSNAKPIYGCTKCVFFIHSNCAEVPERLRHPFHSQHFLSFTKSWPSENGESDCNACGRSISGMSAYHCTDCNFSLHLKCSKLQPSKLSEAELKYLKKHEHPLFICGNMPRELSFRHDCYICGESFLRNYSIVVCLVCRKLLHVSCVLPLEIRHPFHLKHPMAFFRISEGSHLSYPFCMVCWEYVMTAGYLCSDCGVYLHIRCANLQPTSRISEHEPLRHAYCDHHLIECKNQKYKSECMGCKRTIKVFIYVCLKCRLSLCKSCSELLPEITHPFHPLHLLKLVRQHFYTREKCNACNVEFQGKLTYKCSDIECGFRLDPLCAAIKPHAIIKSKDHKHPIAFFTSMLGKDSKLQCQKCSRLCERYFFRCFECYYTIHLECYPSLPQAIKHDCHCDPLILTYSKIKAESDEDSDEDFYCNACEELRNLEDPAYYCKDCYFVAHIHCVWSSIQECVGEESTPLLPSSEPTESLPSSSSHEPSSSTEPTESLPSNFQDQALISSHESSPSIKYLFSLMKMLLHCIWRWLIRRVMVHERQ